MPIHPTRRQMIALGCATLGVHTVQAAPAIIVPDRAATHSIEGRAFASHWRITAPVSVDLEARRKAITALLDRIDRQMSPWRRDSDLTRFNLGPGESPVAPEAAFVARAALEMARDSNGWFDPTVGPLVAQWGFGTITGSQAGHWQALSVEGNSLRKELPGLTMDLCGIAKGRALDLMLAHLQDAGLHDVLVDLGGELKSAGQHPSGRDWQVAIEDPRRERQGFAAGLHLPAGMAVATSGLRAQCYDLGQHHYGHIIDPRLARPAEGDLASVSVLGAKAMQADGWATALFAAGAQGPEIARNRGIAALFLFRDGSDLRAESTGGFDRHMI